MLDLLPTSRYAAFAQALAGAGFQGEVLTNQALRAAMSTDNSVYQIMPALVLRPRDATDLVTIAHIAATDDFADLPITVRGGGTGTNGQSLNKGIIIDTRYHMNRLIAVNAAEGWADVEPGMVLDDLNEQIRASGWFFAPETSTSTRCTIGGMVSTDASGKGSRIYGKTSDNILGLELARPEGLLSSLIPSPDWAKPMLAAAEKSVRAGRAAFIANTPKINRRFTGYDLERAAPEAGGFEWFRLFLGAEGTLGLISKIRVKLRRIEAEKRLLIVGFDSFAQAMAAATPLLAAEPTAIEVMDERVQALAEAAGILAQLPQSLRGSPGARIAFVFIEFNGDDAQILQSRLELARQILGRLPGAGAIHQSADLAEIRTLWAIRSAGVGLLGKVDGPARPVAFVEDCVVPPENLPEFVEEFLQLLTDHGLGFGIYGHVDVGCLHIRPALNIDSAEDRAKLGAVSDGVFALTQKYGGIFWGEHGKGVRGAYLKDWIGPEAYRALQGVKAAFDPMGRFNPGKLVSPRDDIMGVLTTPFRSFNAPDGDPLTKAFRCNGNAQCLSYAAATPMCPSFKATADLRHSPKGRADALRHWYGLKQSQQVSEDFETDLREALDGCLGCKACASACPVQVDIPTMRGAFYADYFRRNRRPLADQLSLLAERASPVIATLSPLLRPFWPVMAKLGAAVTGTVDLPRTLAKRAERGLLVSKAELAAGKLLYGDLILVEDWFTAIFDADLRHQIVQGFRALGFAPRLLPMRPAGKAAQALGDTKSFAKMSARLIRQLDAASRCGKPLVGIDPAFVMQLRQDYPKAGLKPAKLLLPQEYLATAPALARISARAPQGARLKLMLHCTESSGAPQAGADWKKLCDALGIAVDIPQTGCCGMAGLYGHQKRNQDVSRKLFDMSWRKHIASDQPIAATGFSCRCQSERYAQVQIAHPLGLIAEALNK